LGLNLLPAIFLLLSGLFFCAQEIKVKAQIRETAKIDFIYIGFRHIVFNLTAS
jgi:hypothetical protein